MLQLYTRGFSVHATPRYILQLWLCHSPGCSRSWHWQPLAGRRGSSYLRTAGPTPTWPPWLSAPESGWLNSQPDHQCWYAVSVHNYKCIIKFEKVKITNKLSEEACRHFLLKEVLWSYPKCNIFIHTILYHKKMHMYIANAANCSPPPDKRGWLSWGTPHRWPGTLWCSGLETGSSCNDWTHSQIDDRKSCGGNIRIVHQYTCTDTTCIGWLISYS